MSRKVDSVHVDIGARTQKLTRALDTANKGIGGLVRNLGPLGVSATVVAATFAGLVKSTIDFSAELDKIGKRATFLDTTAEEVQQLEKAFGYGAVSVEKMTAGIRFFNRVTGEAISGSKTAQKAFDALGISMDDIADKSTTDRLELVMERLSMIGNEQQRMALGAKLFAAEGQQLVTMAENWASAMERAADQQIFSNEDVSIAEELQDAWSDLSNSFSMFISPTRLNAMKALNNLIKEMNYLLGITPNDLDPLKETRKRLANDLLRERAQSGRNKNQQRIEEIIRQIDEVDRKIIEIEKRKQAAENKPSIDTSAAFGGGDSTKAENAFDKLTKKYQKYYTKLEQLQKDKIALINEYEKEAANTTAEQKLELQKKLQISLTEIERQATEERIRINQLQLQEREKQIRDRLELEKKAKEEELAYIEEMNEKKREAAEREQELKDAYGYDNKREQLQQDIADLDALVKKYDELTQAMSPEGREYYLKNLGADQYAEMLQKARQELQQLDAEQNVLFNSFNKNIDSFADALTNSIRGIDVSWNDFAARMIEDLITMQAAAKLGKFGFLAPLLGKTAGALVRGFDRRDQNKTTVNINNNSGTRQDVKVNTSYDNAKRMVIDIVVEDINNGGSVPTSLGLE